MACSIQCVAWFHIDGGKEESDVFRLQFTKFESYCGRSVEHDQEPPASWSEFYIDIKHIIIWVGELLMDFQHAVLLPILASFSPHR